MTPMLAESVIPRLRRHAPPRDSVDRRSFFLFGLSESAFADRTGDWMERGANPLLGVTAHHGVLSAVLRARGRTGEEGRALVEARAGELRARFEPWIFSEREPEPELVLGRILVEKKLRTAVAESCTGGLVAEKLTRLPGISAVFEAGF